MNILFRPYYVQCSNWNVGSGSCIMSLWSLDPGDKMFQFHFRPEKGVLVNNFRLTISYSWTGQRPCFNFVISFLCCVYALCRTPYYVIVCSISILLCCVNHSLLFTWNVFVRCSHELSCENTGFIIYTWNNITYLSVLLPPPVPWPNTQTPQHTR